MRRLATHSDARSHLFALFVGVAAVLAAPAPASAQSPYIAAAVGIDVSRLDRFEGPFTNDVRPDGEAVAVSLRVGTAIGRRWGVDLAYTRPDQVTREASQGFPIPLLTAIPEGGLVDGALAPLYGSRYRVSRRNSTIDISGWAAQRVGDDVTLVYMAGIAFARVTEKFEFGDGPRVAGLIVPGPTITTTYGMGPLVGWEARIALTDHVFVVPGVRLAGVSGPSGDGWLFRATTGLGWRF